MRRWVCAFGITLAGFVAVPASAGESAGPQPGRLDLNYAIYFGGLHVIDMAIDLDLAASGYDVTTRIRTVGLAGWIAPWQSVATTEGTIRGLRLEPRRHRMDGEFRGHRRSVAIDFAGADVVDIRIIPPPAQDDGRDPVTREQMHGALDPTSALLAVTRRIAAGQGCVGREPVFDGRRRYDVVVVDSAADTLPANDYSLFSGPALRCDFEFVPIAGYESRPAESEERKRRFRTGRAWFAELVPGRPAVPVRIEMGGDVVPTLVHLRDMQPRPDDAGGHER
jgi:Protein of unknown function (DUF3108)